MAYIGPYCVDRYEAHLVEIEARGERPYQPDQRPLPDVRYAARSSPEILPQAYINRLEAEQSCRNAGKRLCSVGEWYRACAGSGGRLYPYGASFVKDRCNVGKPHLLSRFFGDDPRGWKYEEHFNSPMLNRQPGFLALTGEHGGCVSAEGVYDLIGNLHEWVSDKVDRSLPLKVPLADALRRSLSRTRGHGIFMGGFFSTMNEHGRGCRFVTIGHEPTYHDYSTGFRCCKDAAE